MYVRYTGNGVCDLTTGEVVRVYSRPGNYVFVSPYASRRVYSVSKDELFMDIPQDRKSMFVMFGHLFEKSMA